MDLVTSCKDKLQQLRVKELKDVLTRLGLSKQGKKQDHVDRILAILADDQVSRTWAKKTAVSREEVAKLVDETYRNMPGSGATDLASKGPVTSDSGTSKRATDLVSKGLGTTDSGTLKLKTEVDDSFQLDIKVRCPCGNTLLTESRIKCEDSRCQIWQHISCVIIPEKPLDGTPPLPAQFYCEVCRLTRADPFWTTVQHLLHPAKLITTTAPAEGANPVQGVEKTFQLTRSERELLLKPEYAVQAWCMLFNDKVLFRMQWPQYVDLQVNGVPVRAINRPGSQLLGANGRDDGPNISQVIRDGINKISITGCDARIFCVGVRLVKRRTLQQILNIIPKESDGECFEDALARVRRCVGGGGTADDADSDSDLEVVADSFTVNLRCPMSGSRIKIAGRFKPCVHMGCFDLETFVEMQQRSRKWQCPICLKNYSLENIIIDPYFNRITTLMQSCGEDTTEIEVKPDGCWRLKVDTERRDLRQWHLPNGSLCLPDEEEAKHKPEASRPIKQEGTSLKLGIRKNSNGVWEVSKPTGTNTFSSSDRGLEKFENGGNNIIRMSSSCTASGRDGEESVNQGGNGHFDLATANFGVELDSAPSNLQPTYGFANQNNLALARNADVVVLSDDSDEENGMIPHDALHNNSLLDNGFNFALGPHGVSGYQADLGVPTGGSSCLDLFSPPDDEFGPSLWQLPTTSQPGSNFQLFGSIGDCSDDLANPHLSTVSCPASMNGYMLTSDAALMPTPRPSVSHSHNDLNDGLVNNPLAFDREDPALQIFLPTRPSDISGQTDTRNQQDMANGLCGEDLSLRLGDGGWNHMESLAVDRQQHSRQGSLADTATFLLGSNGSRSDKTRERPDSPFSSCPRQKRSVRPRLYIETDSE